MAQRWRRSSSAWSLSDLTKAPSLEARNLLWWPNNHAALTSPLIFCALLYDSVRPLLNRRDMWLLFRRDNRYFSCECTDEIQYLQSHYAAEPRSSAHVEDRVCFRMVFILLLHFDLCVVGLIHVLFCRPACLVAPPCSLLTSPEI